MLIPLASITNVEVCLICILNEFTLQKKLHTLMISILDRKVKKTQQKQQQQNKRRKQENPCQSQKLNPPGTYRTAETTKRIHCRQVI